MFPRRHSFLSLGASDSGCTLLNTDCTWEISRSLSSCFSETKPLFPPNESLRAPLGPANRVGSRSGLHEPILIAPAVASHPPAFVGKSMVSDCWGRGSHLCTPKYSVSPFDICLLGIHRHFWPHHTRSHRKHSLYSVSKVEDCRNLLATPWAKPPIVRWSQLTTSRIAALLFHLHSDKLAKRGPRLPGKKAQKASSLKSNCLISVPPVTVRARRSTNALAGRLIRCGDGRQVRLKRTTLTREPQSTPCSPGMTEENAVSLPPSST